MSNHIKKSIFVVGLLSLSSVCLAAPNIKTATVNISVDSSAKGPVFFYEVYSNQGSYECDRQPVRRESEVEIKSGENVICHFKASPTSNALGFGLNFQHGRGNADKDHDHYSCFVGLHSEEGKMVSDCNNALAGLSYELKQSPNSDAAEVVIKFKPQV